MAFLERNHDPDRSLLVAGSARSGTTWLAEVLSETLHGRLLFEPLRAEAVPRPGPSASGTTSIPTAVPTGLSPRSWTRSWPRIRGRWIDEYNTARFPRCRVVKEIRATNLLPWMVRRYPRTPMVYLLRHPVPSAWSVAQLGWPDNLPQILGQEPLMQGPMAPFGALINRRRTLPTPSSDSSCAGASNFVPTQLLSSGQAHVVFYEHLVNDPRGELVRLSTFLRRFGPGPWDMRLDSTGNLDEPSHTNYRDTDVASGPGRLDDWVGEVPAPGSMRRWPFWAGSASTASTETRHGRSSPPRPSCGAGRPRLPVPG